MGFPTGNQYYLLRSKDGRDKQFTDAEALTDACNKYFQFCLDNPLMAVEQSRRSAGKKQIEVTDEGMTEEPSGLVELPKMRAFTIHGLCNFIDLSIEGFRKYEARDDYVEVCKRARQIIYMQKFEGAASGFLNHNIIARDLGLVDRKDHTTDGEKITVGIPGASDE